MHCSCSNDAMYTHEANIEEQYKKLNRVTVHGYTSLDQQGHRHTQRPNQPNRHISHVMRDSQGSSFDKTTIRQNLWLFVEKHVR